MSDGRINYSSGSLTSNDNAVHICNDWYTENINLFSLSSLILSRAYPTIDLQVICNATAHRSREYISLSTLPAQYCLTFLTISTHTHTHISQMALCQFINIIHEFLWHLNHSGHFFDFT